MYKMKLRDRKQISYYEPEEPPFDEYLYCEKCGDFVFEYCSIHGPLLVIPDDKVPANTGIPKWVPRAALTTPRVFLHIAPSIIPGAGLGVFSTLTLPRGVRFGPYRGIRLKEINSVYCWQLRDSSGKYGSSVVDAEDTTTSNWMRYVNCARHKCEQNLIAYQYRGEIYYRTIKIIPKFTELMVFYGSEFANSLGIDLRKYNSIQQYYNVIGKILIIDEKVDNSLIIIGQKENNDIIKESIADYNYQNTDNMIEKHQTIVEYVEEIIPENIDMQMDISETDALEPEIKDSEFNNDTYEDMITDHLNAVDVSNNNTYSEYNSTDTMNINEYPQTVTCKLEVEHFINDNDNGIEEKHICPLCNKTFTRSKYLSRHKIRHLEPTRFCCDICNYKTNFSSDYKKHIKIHEKLNTENNITERNKNNDIRDEFENSVAVSHKAESSNIFLNSIANENKYICQICNKTCTNSTNLKNHRISHEPIQFYCVKCSYVTNYSKNYKRHLKIHDRPINTNSNDYNSQKNETDHSITVNCKAETQCIDTFIINSNINEEKYICDVCNKTYTNSRNLRRHKFCHLETMRFDCAKCNYKTNYADRYKRHLKIHKELITKQCSNNISDNNNLNWTENDAVNFVSVTYKTENQCNNTFFLNNNDKDRKYICNVCNKIYTNSDSLRRHKLSHLETKRFHCIQCSYKTNYGDRYKRHLKVHKD